jgi:plastocyanin
MRSARTLGRRLTLAASALLLFFGACGDLPETTENARGVITGPNLVLAMSVIFLVVAVGLLVAAVGTDRFFKTRAALAEGTPADLVEEEDETDEVVAGITVGRAAVPRWLYGAYVLIPVFAFAYVFSNIRPPQAAEPTPTPDAGPCTECEIAASQVLFTEDLIQVAAGEEVTVTFDNTDSTIHDFTVWEDEAAAQSNDQSKQIVTTGTVSPGASKDAKFDAPEESYFFNCTIHPASMVGTVETG